MGADEDEDQDVVSVDFAASCRFRREVADCTRYWLGLDAAASASPVEGEEEEEEEEEEEALRGILGWRWLFSWIPFGVFIGKLTKAKETPRVAPPISPDLRNSVFEEFGERVAESRSKGYSFRLFYRVERPFGSPSIVFLTSTMSIYSLPRGPPEGARALPPLLQSRAAGSTDGPHPEESG